MSAFSSSGFSEYAAGSGPAARGTVGDGCKESGQVDACKGVRRARVRKQESAAGLARTDARAGVPLALVARSRRLGLRLCFVRTRAHLPRRLLLLLLDGVDEAAAEEFELGLVLVLHLLLLALEQRVDIADLQLAHAVCLRYHLLLLLLVRLEQLDQLGVGT